MQLIVLAIGLCVFVYGVYLTYTAILGFVQRKAALPKTGKIYTGKMAFGISFVNGMLACVSFFLAYLLLGGRK